MQKRVMFIAILLLAICNKIVAANGIDEISISDFSLYSGGTKEVSVVMTNTFNYVGFQFDLVLPEGITVDSFSASERIPQGTSLQMAQQTDGSYRFIAYAQNRLPITGNDGAIMTLTLKASESVVPNSYTGYLRDVKMSTVDGGGVVIVDQLPFTITVKDIEPYAALTGDSILTFYYDNKKEERNGMSVGPFGDYPNYQAWYNNRETITQVFFDDSFANCTTITSTHNWFFFCSKITSIIGLHNLKTNNVTDMSYMFYGCSGLATLDVTKFKTDNVTDMSGMFDNCAGLTSLDVSHFKTDNVTNMHGMFRDCSNLTSLDLSNFKTDNVTDMGDMFLDCYELTNLDMTNFNTVNVTNMSFMFYICSRLTNLDVTNFKTDNVAHMKYMFYRCSGLKTLDLSNFKTDNVTNMEYMFSGCSSLSTVYAGSGWTTTAVTEGGYMFSGCTYLKGGAGTTYDENHIDATYAHIDGGTANPGYFTDINAPSSYTVTLSVSDGGAVTVNHEFEDENGKMTFTVAPGDSLDFIIIPQDGFQLTSVMVDTLNVTNDVRKIEGSESLIYTLQKIYQNHNVHVSFTELGHVAMPTIISWSGDTLRAVSATEGAIVNCILRQTSDGPVAQWSGGPDPQLTLPIESDLFVELFATKEGLLTSDTLKFYYPYTAWHQLADAINDANTVLAAAANNDNVPQQMLNELKALTDEAQTMYRYRDAKEVAIKDKTVQIRDLTDAIRRLANAQDEPYAVLSEGNTVLTFYYDKKKAERNGMGIGPFSVRFDDERQQAVVNSDWFEQRNSIIAAEIDSSFAKYNSLTSTGFWFYECKNMKTISGIQYLNTENVTDMGDMFNYCESLLSVDMSGFNTSNVLNMRGMFGSCYSLTSIDLTNFNTAKVQNMANMFSGCEKLTTLDVSSFNTAEVSNISAMFSGCSNLTTIYAGSEWYLNVNVDFDGNWVFLGCTNLVGGAGTVYDADHIDYTYAHIDGGTSNPGYFTDINSGVTIYVQASQAPYLYAFDADGTALNGEFPGNQMAETVTVDGQTFWKTHIYRPVPFNINILDAEWYRTHEIYVISDRYFVYEGTSKYIDVTNRYAKAPEIQISSLALPGNHNDWNKAQMFTETEPGKKYTMEVDLTNVTIEDDNNLFQFKLLANACAWLGFTSLTLDAPSYVHGMGNPELIASDRNIVMDLNSTPTRKFLFEATWNGGYQMEEGWTLKISEIAVPHYTYDSTTGVLTISGGTTVADALEAAGGSSAAATLTSIIWDNPTPLTNSDLQGLDNPNMLIYVSNASLAPERDNVVVGNDSTGYTAMNIVLTDVEEGNNDFYCPIAFVADMISYTHEYRQQTEIGVARGWETIAMPFTVQTIMHEKNGLIAPFGSDASTKHFWLRQLTQQGLARAIQIEANTPYLISMPNNDAYPAELNLAGRVTFSSQQTLVPVTQANGMEAPIATGGMVMIQPNFKRQSAMDMIYTLNVGVPRGDRPEGSVFEANYRSVRPFEAFTVHHGDGPAPQFISITDINNGGATGIEDVIIPMSDGSDENWYDLQGRKIVNGKSVNGKLPHGVYIRNGKKTVVR